MLPGRFTTEMRPSFHRFRPLYVATQTLPSLAPTIATLLVLDNPCLIEMFGNGILTEPVDAVDSDGPNIAFPILKKSGHGVARKTISLGKNIRLALMEVDQPRSGMPTHNAPSRSRRICGAFKCCDKTVEAPLSNCAATDFVSRLSSAV